MRDIVNVESEFTKNMISSLISRALKNKKDINIDIHFNEFHAENNDGTLSIHIDANTEISEEDLEKILNKIHFLKKIIMGLLNKRCGQDAAKWVIKKILKKDIDIKINDLKCSMKESVVYVHLSANAEMLEENLKMMLEDAKLL